MKLRAGIIGLGVGEQHAEAYRRHPACEVAALCDLDPEKREAARRKFPGARVVARDRDILGAKDVDVVSIASYDSHHYGQIVGAIEGGQHVFVEKPVCLREEEARHIRDLLRANPSLRMSSNLVLRMSPRFLLLRGMIRRGDLGELFYVEGDYNYGRLEKITRGWRGAEEFYSVILGGGVHVVDLLLWLTGDRVEEVCAFGNAIASRGTGFRFNDMAVGILRFRSGLVGKVSANFGCVSPHFHPLLLYGTRATFRNGLPHGELHTSRDPAVPPLPIDAAYPGVEKGALIAGFVDRILGKAGPGDDRVPADDIFETMSVCFALEESARENRPVRVRYI